MTATLIGLWCDTHRAYDCAERELCRLTRPQRRAYDALPEGLRPAWLALCLRHQVVRVDAGWAIVDGARDGTFAQTARELLEVA